MMTRILTIATCILLVAVPMTATGQSNGGGSVNNLLPSLGSLGNVEGGTANTGATDVLSGTVSDVNGEDDLQTIRIQITGAATETKTLDVTTQDWSTNTTEPASFTSGWKVWNSGAVRDGVISFEFQYTYTVSGTYTLTIDATDGAYGTADAIVVTVSEAIVVAGDPVLSDGTADTGARWGGWAADPGAVNVTTGNFLKVTNNGEDDTQEVTIDFTGFGFAGVSDSTWSVAIDGYIQFACAETQTGLAPQDLTFTFESTSSSGSATCSFTAGSSGGTGILYVQYRIVSIDSPMKDQTYEASYTVTA